jgi:hypothetical protein
METASNSAINYYNQQKTIDRVLEQFSTYTRLGDSYLCSTEGKGAVLVKNKPQYDRTA